MPPTDPAVPTTPPVANVPATPPPSAPPTTPTTPEPAPPPQDPSAPPATPDEPPRPRAQDRIEELVAQNKAEREAMAEYAEFWRNQAQGPQRGAPQAPAEVPDPAPTLESNGYDAVKWQESYAAWTSREIKRQVTAGVTSGIATSREQETAQQVNQRWQTNLAEFSRGKPDAARVINNPALQISPVMTEVITASDNGVELAYYLGNNPLEAMRISRLPPALAASEMGMIRASLKAAAAAPAPPRAPTHSNAPPPPSTPVGGGGAPLVDMTTCSLDDYVRIRLEQRAARAGRR